MAAELLMSSRVSSVFDRGPGRGAVLTVTTDGRLRRDDTAMFTVESTLIAAQGQKLDFDLPQAESTVITDFKSFEEMERDYILQVLKAKNWKIGGKDSAASILGMPPSTLRSRMKKLGLKKP